MNSQNIFSTDFKYTSREEKAEYVWRKYGSIFDGKSLLDVGGDECHLKGHLDGNTRYWGIGLGGNPDQTLDLDSGPLPFSDGEFETVLCLDVLEHLEHIHFMFDELCRVSSGYVIISLPNCLGHLWRIMTRFGMETNEGLMKYYGLPLEPPEDRHRWFFDAIEAEKFIQHRAILNGMNIVQIDCETATTIPTKKKRFFLSLAKRIILRQDIEPERFDYGTTWAVLKLPSQNS